VAVLFSFDPVKQIAGTRHGFHVSAHDSVEFRLQSKNALWIDAVTAKAGAAPEG
jgi:hypothetical protein